MYIVVNIEVLEKYFKNNIPRTKNEVERNIDELFSNKKNILLLSQNYIKLTEQYMDAIGQNYRAYWNGFIEDLYTNGRYKGIESGKSMDLEDEFLHILNSENENLTLAFSISKTAKSIASKKKDKLAFLSSCVKLSNEWLLLTIGAKHQIQVRYYDFTSKAQIDKFFESVFALPKKINEVYIFDRLCNVNHNLYAAISKKKIKIKCFKLRAGLADIMSIENHFGKPFEIWNTNRLDLIHERNILFEDIIIESNEDPVNIDISRKTWAINIQYSKTDYANLISKESEFNLYSQKTS